MCLKKKTVLEITSTLSPLMTNPESANMQIQMYVRFRTGVASWATTGFQTKSCNKSPQISCEQRETNMQTAFNTLFCTETAKQQGEVTLIKTHYFM